MICTHINRKMTTAQSLKDQLKELSLLNISKLIDKFGPLIHLIFVTIHCNIS